MNQVRRRQFLITAGALLAAPLPGFAQQPAAAIPRIGFLGVSTPAAWAPRVDAFRAGLRDLGYVEGKNIVIEFRFARRHSTTVFPSSRPSSSGSRWTSS